MKKTWLQCLHQAAVLCPGAVLLTSTLQAQEDSHGESSPLNLTQPNNQAFPWADAGAWISWFWNLRVVRIGDADVLVSQIAFALLLLIGGIWAARRLSRGLKRRLTTRTSLDASAVAAVEKLLFYLLMVVVIIMAMQAMRIPIAIFTIFGGAIAIGVGFGAQNIFNNFISGLILMLDRPIRLGDTVEVSNHYGKIAEIGARCTRLRRFDGIDVLVPNSALVENDVINWTLADKQVRQVVRVGIAYGSNLQKASDLLLQAANERKEVLNSGHRSSQVIFEDFGDNALTFDLFFWLELSELINMRSIRSDIRFRIDHLFREAGISIAFPQRDIHLNTLRPLEVKMITEPTAGLPSGTQKEKAGA